MPASTTAQPGEVAARAKNLGTPNLDVLRDAPETPGEIHTVEQVDWQSMILAALGPTTTLDKPLPQLLLRLSDVITDLTGNAEHLKRFAAGLDGDQIDLADKVDKRFASRNERRRKTEDNVARLEVGLQLLTERVEQLEAERAQAHATPETRVRTVLDDATVQSLNA